MGVRFSKYIVKFPTLKKQTLTPLPKIPPVDSPMLRGFKKSTFHPGQMTRRNTLYIQPERHTSASLKDVSLDKLEGARASTGLCVDVTL